MVITTFLSWEKCEEIIGHPHNGQPEDDEKLMAYLSDQGYPAELFEGGFIEQEGWYLPIVKPTAKHIIEVFGQTGRLLFSNSKVSMIDLGWDLEDEEGDTVWILIEETGKTTFAVGDDMPETFHPTGDDEGTLSDIIENFSQFAVHN